MRIAPLMATERLAETVAVKVGATLAVAAVAAGLVAMALRGEISRLQNLEIFQIRVAEAAAREAMVSLESTLA